MKNPVRTTPRSKAIIIAAAFAAALLHQFSSRADVVYVTSMPQGCTTTTGSCAPPNADGTYSEINVSLSNTGIKGSGSGRPVTANFSRYYPASAQLTDTTAGVDIKPVLALNNWVYQIDYNWNAN